tara:strand:- start:342 stop:611 length:270 start_codon:yes stop_codon:yes gene_type:complete
MTLLEQVRDLLTFTRNACADLDDRGVQRHLYTLSKLVSDEGLEIDPEGDALFAIEQVQETMLMIDDGSSPEWGEIPDAIDQIEDEIDWD